MWEWRQHFGWGDVVLWTLLAVIVVVILLAVWWPTRHDDGQ